MSVELQTNLFEKIDNLTINQCVLLSLVLDEDQTNNQDVITIVSHINDDEIQELIDNNYITYNSKKRGINKYKATNKLLDLLDYNSFNIFYELYPTYVNRPDGTKGFLKGNKKKCKKQYDKIIRSITPEHLLKCLKEDIDDKSMTGKLGYMKTLWNWLTQCEWEVIEDKLREEQSNSYNYGTELL